MTPKVFVDTCVFIEVFAAPTNCPERFEPCRWVLRAAERGAHEIVVSTLVPAEVMGLGQISAKDHPERAARTEKVKSYFASSQVHLVEVDRLLMQRAMSISEDHAVRGSDAIHIAAALRSECSTFFTYDGRLLKLNGQLGSLNVIEPVIGDGQEEFDM